jgi:uncharacterized membrane protein HdeD (DUF308 family)
MSERAMSIAREHAPWRAETPWWVIGVQGIVLVAIALYLLLAPSAAGPLIIQLIALWVLIESVLHIIAGLRNSTNGANPYTMLQAGIGVTIGLLLVFRDWLVPTLDVSSARTILGLGLLAYAGVGVVGALVNRDESESWLGPVVSAVLMVVLAVLLLTSGEDNAADRLAFLGWVALIGGALLLLLAWRARSRPRTV